ncbi:MAG: AAA family ATPase [Candidatus Dormibacteria bacterium]
MGPTPSTGLPLPTDRFFGRSQELAALAATLSKSSLITLTGTSGVGKTRLALELSRRVSQEYPDGVHFVELAALVGPSPVVKAVAATLSVWEQPGRSLLAALVARLRGLRLMLILDGCERVREGCVEVAEALLGSCPEVSVLATSQQDLGLPHELVWPVAPLSVPESTEPPKVLAANPAISLFRDRAGAMRPGFRPSNKTLPVVAEICRRLDGLPLAIELVAARVGVLTPRELVARLDERLTILTGGDQNAPPRHRSLELALNWSHDLLSEAEQLLFRRLSVFVGPLTWKRCEPSPRPETGLTTCSTPWLDYLRNPLCSPMSRTISLTIGCCRAFDSMPSIA